MAIYKNNNGTWYVMIRYQDWTGVRKQKCKRGFATRKEAADWELQFKLQKMIIPLRRSRLSGKTETICPERRKPLQFIAACGKAACMLLCLRWIQPINLSHGNILFWIKTHNRNLV